MASSISVDEIIKHWQREPRESAERIILAYGEPHEFSESMLIWRETPDGWKRSELTNEPTPHNFPAAHSDFLAQFIDYKVPIGMFSILAFYDGSVVCDRTRGELSVRCGGTAMNFAAINLAHDIITGRRTVELARSEYTRLYKAFAEGETPPYTQGFQFEMPFGDTRDPDVRHVADRWSS